MHPAAKGLMSPAKHRAGGWWPTRAAAKVAARAVGDGWRRGGDAPGGEQADDNDCPDFQRVSPDLGCLGSGAGGFWPPALLMAEASPIEGLRAVGAA